MTKTAYLIAFAFVLLVLLRVATLLSLRRKATQEFIPIISALELVAWASIIIGGVNVFFSDKLYYPYLLIFLVITFSLLLVWYFFKDIVAGYLFRIRHNPKIGQLLSYDELEGSIRLLGLSHLTLELITGQWHRVPYSLIVNKRLVLKSLHSIAPGETVIKVSLNPGIEPSHFERSVRKMLALSSWCIAAKPIRITADQDEDNTFQISFFMLDPSFHTIAKLKLTALAENLGNRMTSVTNYVD